MNSIGNELIKLIQEEKWFQHIVSGIGKPQGVHGLSPTLKVALLVALTEFLAPDKPLILLVAQREEIRDYRSELSYFYPDLKMLELYPKDLVTERALASSPEVVAERLAALELMASGGKGIVFVTAEAAEQHLPALQTFKAEALKLTVGEKMEQEAVATKLTELGYEHVEQVETQGQFALRGEILDVFPLNQNYPYRLEWWDEEIDGIRSFALDSQRSLESSLELGIVPCKELNTKEAVTLFAYAAQRNLLVAVNEPSNFCEKLSALAKENEAWNSQLWPEGEVRALLASYPRLLTLSLLPSQALGTFEQSAAPVRQLAPYNKDTVRLIQDLRNYLANGISPIVMLSNQEKAKATAESVSNYGINCRYVERGPLYRAGCVSVFTGFLSKGFYCWDAPWVLITEGDIYGVQKKKRLARQKNAGPALSYYKDIKAGDYVVHDVHGIGRYEGVETIELDGMHKNYMYIAYAAGDKLFVPMDQVSHLHKYVGAEGIAPRLSKMGGADWSKIKGKAKKAICEMAAELLRLYAQRKMTTGYAFSPDTTYQRDFEESFPFEETPDQLKAIEEIKADMERPVPMERLLCGDVGYGKTEVAIRAAFKAVMDGKQVAVLAPTTVLSQQHLLTFRQRMDAFGVKIAMLSRFRTPREQHATIKDVAEGKVDILIGTHRILQPDVSYHDLGLLIIDEEQRFGVAQKEKIKRQVTGIDILSLSATPIPRTLHLSLVKGRDMSIIESPPEDRLPVETYVAEYNDALVKEAIERELKRGGRIYYVYNRIEELSAISVRLRSLVPSLTVRIAHGRMPERELEDVMIGFYEGEFDLLLSTTIIENGLDVPLANTIIVEGADCYGLSQLYQMRGRVGRSSRLAYAYFLYRKNKILTAVAQKRLTAIRDFTQLGAGFQIAMRDLEIRGAGNILGAQQHGHIAGIGFATYCELLEEAVASIAGTPLAEQQVPDPILELRVDAFLPDDYIADPRHMMELYTRAIALDYDERRDFLDELIDRFGTPPKEVLEFWRLVVVRSLCRKLRIQSISDTMGQIYITFDRATTCDSMKLAAFVTKNKSNCRYIPRKDPLLMLNMKLVKGNYLEFLEGLLNGLRAEG